MRPYYVRASKLAGLTQIAAERGMALHPVMREVGLDPEVLRTPEAVIDYAAFCELLRRCANAWDLPDVGLRMVRFQQIDVLGPVALLTRMERTVRGALAAIAANLVIHSNATVVAVEDLEGSDTASLILSARDTAPDGRENTELILAQSKMVIESLANRPVHLVEVSFTHAKGNSARAVAAHFGCPIRYGADRNAMSFDRELLDRPIERSDLAYHALIRRFITTARAELEGGFAEDVRAEVARQMELGHCTLEMRRPEPAHAAAQPAAPAARRGAVVPRPGGRVAPGAGAGAGHQHPAAAVGGVGGAGLFRAERFHPGVPPLVRRHAAALPVAEDRGGGVVEPPGARNMRAIPNILLILNGFMID